MGEGWEFSAEELTLELGLEESAEGTSFLLFLKWKGIPGRVNYLSKNAEACSAG